MAKLPFALLLVCFVNAMAFGTVAAAVNDAALPPEVAAFERLTRAQRLELVDLASHKELVHKANETLVLDVRAALGAGYSPRTVSYLSAWFNAHPGATATKLAPVSSTLSVPTIVATKVMRQLAKNWSRIYNAVVRVCGSSVANKYLSQERVQRVLDSIITASDSIDGALSATFAYLLPPSLQLLVQPLVWAVRFFLI